MPPEDGHSGGRARRILCVGYDAGGLNLIAAMLRFWLRDNRIDASFASAASKVSALSREVPNLKSPAWAQILKDDVGTLGVPLAGLAQDPGVIDDIKTYDAVLVGTSFKCALDRQLIRIARRNDIPAYALCDMWYAYRERFCDSDGAALPTAIFALDARMAAEIGQVPDLSQVPVRVVGSPMYDDLLAHARSSRLGEAITFISEPAAELFPQSRVDEMAVAQMVLNAALARGMSHRLRFRPHPSESIARWETWLADRASDARLDRGPLDAMYGASGRGIGISSILLTQMAIRGIPVASVQPAGADPNYYCLPFADFGIGRLTNAAEVEAFLTAPPRPPKLSSNVLAHAGAMARITGEILGR